MVKFIQNAWVAYSKAMRLDKLCKDAEDRLANAKYWRGLARNTYEDTCRRLERDMYTRSNELIAERLDPLKNRVEELERALVIRDRAIKMYQTILEKRLPDV